MTCRLQQRRGFAATATLTLTALAMVSVIAMASVSMGQMRLSTRAQKRALAQAIAEAGVDDTVDRFRLDPEYGMTGSTHTPITLQPVTIYEDPVTKQRPIGSFQVAVEWMDDETRKVTSVAYAPNTPSSIGAVVATVRVPLVGLGNGALVSRGNISISGNASINTINPTGKHVADAVSNANITMGGSSEVDGQLRASGTVTGAGYFPSESGVPEQHFPDAATTNAWKTSFITTAKSGTTITRSVTSSISITAPAYIRGNIQLQNDEVVELLPNSDPSKNIIYVEDNIKLTGQSKLINNVTLVVGGTFEQSGGSTYRIATGVTPTPTLVAYGGMNPEGRTTVSLAGNSSSDQQGVVYAVNGNIEVAGGAIFTGAVVAGGVNGEIKVGGDYTHYFPTTMSSFVTFRQPGRVETLVEL